MEIIYGLHPVEESLRSGTRRFDHVSVSQERHDQRLQAIVELCRAAKVPLRTEPRDALTRVAGTASHQGVVAIVREREFLTTEDLLEGPEPRLVLALDGVEDPQNLGAILRTAEAAGVDGVLLTERRSAPLSPVAIKASAGATSISAWPASLTSSAPSRPSKNTISGASDSTNAAQGITTATISGPIR